MVEHVLHLVSAPVLLSGQDQTVQQVRCMTYVHIYNNNNAIHLSLPLNFISSNVLYIAICVPSCSNGGTCTSPGVCRCTSGWSGSRCDDRE